MGDILDTMGRMFRDDEAEAAARAREAKRKQNTAGLENTVRTMAGARVTGDALSADNEALKRTVATQSAIGRDVTPVATHQVQQNVENDGLSL